MEIEFSCVQALDIKEKNQTSLELPDDTTIKEVMDKLEIPEEKQPHVRAIVNNDEKRPTYTLQGGDKLHLFIHVRS